jgi:hypothetical protein
LDTNLSEDCAVSIFRAGPLKHWYKTTTQHGAMNQKTTNSPFTAMKTSNLQNRIASYLIELHHSPTTGCSLWFQVPTGLVEICKMPDVKSGEW